MATYRASVSNTATDGSDPTRTISPDVGDLFLIAVCVSGNSTAAVCTDDNGSGTYTLIRQAGKNASADIMLVYVRDSLFTNTTSTTITVASGTNTAWVMHTIAITGIAGSGATVVRQSARQTNQAGGTTPAPTFASSALTGNLCLGFVGNGTNPAGMTPPASFTERRDTGEATPDTGLETVTIDNGFTGTTVTWGGTSTSAFASVIVELDATGSLGTASITLGAATVVGTGTVDVLGTASITLGALTSVGTGTVSVLGTAAITLGAATLVATGTVANPAPGSVTAIITVPVDGDFGDSGTENPYHIAGYTIEQFSSDTSTVSGAETRIVHTAWSADDGWTDTGRHVQHVFATAGVHTITCTVTGDGGATDSDTKQITTIAFAPAWERYVKASGSDAANGLTDGTAYATIEKAFDVHRSLGSDPARQGVLSAIYIKDTDPPAFTGLADGTHDPSPDHGFLVITRYGTSTIPTVACSDNTNITCNPDSHVPDEWGWSVYVKDVNFTWAGRHENNSISLGNPGSQFDGCAITNAFIPLQGNSEGPVPPVNTTRAFINSSVTTSGKDGMFASVSWCIIDNVTLNQNTLDGVNAEHQLYGSESLNHWSYRRITVVGSTEGNDGLRSVSARIGYVADCSVTDIANAGDAYFPGANNAGDRHSSEYIAERVICNAANSAFNINSTDDAVLKNFIVKGTSGSSGIKIQSLDATDRADDIRVYHGVFYDNDNRDLFVDDVATNVAVSGSIFQRTNATAFLEIEDETNVTFDYNVYWREGGTPGSDAIFAIVAGVTKTFAEWQALGQDTNSVFADPLFTSPTTGDFTLQSGSPCIAAMPRIGEVRYDFDENARTSTTSIGIYEQEVIGDTTPPTVSITAPLNGATVSGTIVISATASDDVGVVGVQFKRMGVNLGTEDLNAPYSRGWDTTTVPDGAHSLTAVARDAAGNSTLSAAVTVFVVNTPGGGGETGATLPSTTPGSGRGPLFVGFGTGPFRPYIGTRARLFPTIPHRRK